LFASGSAFAQTAEFHCPAPTTVALSNGAQIMWLAQDGHKCLRVLQLDTGEKIPQVWYGPTFVGDANQSLAFFEQTRAWTLWPLQVGKKITGRYDGAGGDPGDWGSWLYTTEVEKYERISTDAGDFDAFVIAQKEEALGDTFKGVSREWYVPALGVSVKTTYSDNQGSDEWQEAVSISKVPVALRPLSVSSR
jgi:hypothetical protein